MRSGHCLHQTSRTIFNSGAERAIIVKEVLLSVQPDQPGAGLADTVTEGIAARKSSYARSTSGSGILPGAATTAISRFLTAKINRRPRCQDAQHHYIPVPKTTISQSEQSVDPLITQTVRNTFSGLDELSELPKIIK